jgi:hypothetical protein
MISLNYIETYSLIYTLKKEKRLQKSYLFKSPVRKLPKVEERCPRCDQKYRELSKNIEIHQSPEILEKGYFRGEITYFLRAGFFLRFLHTGEVRGSNPVSPTDLFRDAYLLVGLP